MPLFFTRQVINFMHFLQIINQWGQIIYTDYYFYHLLGVGYINAG